MDFATDSAFFEDEMFTLGQLCSALASGRVAAEERDGAYEIRQLEVRRWQREESSVRTLLSSVGDGAWINGGLI